MENDTEANTGNEGEVDTDDDCEDALLELEDDDDDDIDMDDIRLFDEEDICVTEVSGGNQVMQKTGIDAETDISTSELCPFENGPTFNKGKTHNQENSLDTYHVGSVMHGVNALPQEIIKETLSESNSLDLGTSENVSLDRREIIQQRAGETVCKDKGVTQQPVEELSEITSCVNLGQSTEGHSEGQSSGTRNVSDSQRSKVVLTYIEDQPDLEQTKVRSDIDDIKLIKPKERKSPRKAFGKETETIVPVTDTVTHLRSQVGTRGSDRKARLDTTLTTTPSSLTSRSDNNSPTTTTPSSLMSRSENNLPNTLTTTPSSLTSRSDNNLPTTLTTTPSSLTSRSENNLPTTLTTTPSCLTSRSENNLPTTLTTTPSSLTSRSENNSPDILIITPSSPASRSENDSPEVVAIQDPSPLCDSETDCLEVENGLHKCYLCQVEFKSKTNLTVHTRTMHSYYSQLPVCGCTHCGAEFKSEAFAHKHERKVHSLDTACAFCGKTQSTKEALQIHVCNHLQPLTYLCMLCREDFPNVVEAEKHLSKHKGEVAFWSDFLKCRFCGSLFSKRDKLFSHVMKVHEDLFCIKCKSCSQPFYLDSALAVHRSDQNGRLDGKRIRVHDKIDIQFGVTSGKVSKDLIDISEDGSFESHNEACALKLRNNNDNNKSEISPQDHLEMLFNLGKLDTKDSLKSATQSSDGDVASSQSTNSADSITAKHRLMAKLLDKKRAQKPSTATPNDKDQETRKSSPVLLQDSLENCFQRIMFRAASNIQELLRFSLTIEGHVTQQSHQFLAKVYDQKFKVVMVLWTELQSLTQAVNTDVFAKGNKLSKEIVDELLCTILKSVHVLRQSKTDTIVLMGKCIAEAFQGLITVMVGVNTIITPGLQLIAVNHYEHWLDFLPTIIDAQWNVFKEIATNYTDNKNNQVLELVGKLWHSRITLNQAVLLKKEENKKWKQGLHPLLAKSSGQVEGEVRAKENMKQMLFKMTNDTAVFVAGKSTPVAISSVEPGTNVMIPVVKLPTEMQGQTSDTINILPGTQSSKAGAKTIPPVAHLPGFLSNEQHEGYRLAYISEGYLGEGIRPVTVSVPQQPISIDLISDTEENDDDGPENTEDNVEYSDDGGDCNDRSGKKSASVAEALLMDCTDDDPTNGDVSNQTTKISAKATIVTSKENVDAQHLELDCVNIKPEPMDYTDITVDLCLLDDDDDDNDDDEEKKEKDENDEKKDPVSLVIMDSENNEEIKIMIAEDHDSSGNKTLNTSPQVKQEKLSDSGGDTGMSDPAQSISNKRSLPDDEPSTGPQPNFGIENFMAPPNKKLKLVQIFNSAAFENTNTTADTPSHLPEGETTPQSPSMHRVKNEPIKQGYPDVTGETTLNVKKEPVLPSYNEGLSAPAIPHTVVTPKIKYEPAESASVIPCSVAHDSIKDSQSTVQEQLKDKMDTQCEQTTQRSNSEVIKSERCETPQSDSEVLKAYYS